MEALAPRDHTHSMDDNDIESGAKCTEERVSRYRTESESISVDFCLKRPGWSKSPDKKKNKKKKKQSR